MQSTALSDHRIFNKFSTQGQEVRHMDTEPESGSAFWKLIEAHDASEEDAARRIRDLLRLEVEEDTSWEESELDEYDEFPVVTQSFKVFLGKDLIYEGERQFGITLEDATHTGLGGEWVTIRIDDERHISAEDALEELGLEIDWPDVPPPR
jgi:hypothetical protein